MADAYKNAHARLLLLENENFRNLFQNYLLTANVTIYQKL